MQGERASLGSLSEALNFEHGSSSNNTVTDQQFLWENNTHNLVDHHELQHNYMISSPNTNTTFANHHEQRDLHRFSFGEATSNGTKNEEVSHHEQWMGFGRFQEHRNPFLQPPSGNRLVRNVNLNAEYNEHLEDMNHHGFFEVNGLGSNSVGAGLSIDERRASCKRKAIDSQSSSNGGFREFHRGESSSSRVSAPSFYSQGSDLNISLDHDPRGCVSWRPRDQQETISQSVYAEQYGHAASQNPNTSRIRMPHISRNTTPPFQWSGSPISATPIDRRSIIHLDEETNERSNNLELPLFLPPRHLTQNVASSSSRRSVQPLHERRFAEQVHRSMHSIVATNQRGAPRSFVPPPAHVVQSSGDNNTFQVQNRAYSRTGTRQVQNAIGVPHSSTSRGRSRMRASEILSVLQHMRRGGDLRFEEVMLLNQLGVADDINDRYRDMRLDVDNMTYEELLSLGEKIGDVCTGLNDETILNRLKQEKYKSRSTRSLQEVEPCCICREEYKEGEEMGMLECGHNFHSQCIKEWLKVKNLCPICKTTGLNTAENPRR